MPKPDIRATEAALRRWAPLVLLAIGIAAYHNSFAGPFLFDDIGNIVQNPHLWRLWPLTEAMRAPADTGIVGRPIVNLSLALNYAFGGLGVWGYHTVNLAIHLVAALFLFGIARRTLLSARLRSRYQRSASGLAFAIALLWMVHPLQTASVTYIIQRSESLMGLWYLGTLYAVIRGAASTHHRRWWDATAVMACALGMGSKPVMATAPLLVLAYDRVFLSQPASPILRDRGWLYAGLAATWAVLVLSVRSSPDRFTYAPSAGFALTGVSPLAYALTQPGVILHYLRLAVWPHPLCLDYHWPLVRSISAAVGPGLAVGALLASTLVARYRAPAVGFLGVWFFLVLAPSSSVIPLADAAFEHRMYLPLAAVIALVVLGLARMPLPRVIGIGAVAAATITLALLTMDRNAQYRDPIALWQQTVALRPENPRAHVNLGALLTQQGDVEAAKTHELIALRLDPRDAKTQYNLGLLLAQQHQLDEAIQHFQHALTLTPLYADAHNNLGAVLLLKGRLADARGHFEEALRINPNHAQARYNMALVTQRLSPNGP